MSDLCGEETYALPTVRGAAYRIGKRRSRVRQGDHECRTANDESAPHFCLLVVVRKSAGIVPLGACRRNADYLRSHRPKAAALPEAQAGLCQDRGGMRRRQEPWNHNIHYLDLLVAAAPEVCVSALDVGCGDGVLTSRLRRVAPHVVWIDVDPATISRARQHDHRPGLDFLVGDFLTYPFEAESFDFITCSAAIHHVPLDRALRRMADLLRAGGVLAILGLARSRYPSDLPRDAAAVVANRLYLVARTEWESSAPAVCPPGHAYGDIRRVAEHLLPRHRWRRHLLWRYSIVWTKPHDHAQTGAKPADVRLPL